MFEEHLLPACLFVLGSGGRVGLYRKSERVDSIDKEMYIIWIIHHSKMFPVIELSCVWMHDGKIRKESCVI